MKKKKKKLVSLGGEATYRDGVGPLQLGRRPADALGGGRGAAGKWHVDEFSLVPSGAREMRLRARGAARALLFPLRAGFPPLFMGVICLRLLTSNAANPPPLLPTPTCQSTHRIRRMLHGVARVGGGGGLDGEQDAFPHEL